MIAGPFCLITLFSRLSCVPCVYESRFAESFRSLHSKNLLAAEKRAIEMFVNGDMPAAKGKRKLKPMTEVF